MVEQNPTRINLVDRFNDLIADYNAGSRNIEELFNELLQLSKEMSEDEQRSHR